MSLARAGLIVHWGRPSIKATFHELSAQCIDARTKRVAVMACGPSSLMRKVKGCCDRAVWSWSSAAFDYHAETFEW
jgi:hypothetical protein